MKREKLGRIGFVIGSGAFYLLTLAVTELNQNRLVGLILTALLGVAFWVVHARFLVGQRWQRKAAGWLLWLLLFAVTFAATWPPYRPVPAVAGKDPQKTAVLTLSGGQVQGVVTDDGQVEVFAGIPYAKAPVGDLRWREPQDPEPWQGVLTADHFAPMSMQPTHIPLYDSLMRVVGYHDYRPSVKDNYRAPVSEDALYVNVWRPAGGGENLPVVVYIHGGSLQTGQPWYADYGGEGLARQGVIVINMGYRLGVFGYLADAELAAESPHGTTGNYGLLDQIKALTWVRDNIGTFGGDPANVTLSGESAGSASVSALCTSPLSAGLFQRVVMESSTVASVKPPHSFRLLDEALESGKTLKNKYRCATIAELRALPAEKLVGEAETQHHMTVDGYALTETPYQSYKHGVHNETAILHGYNHEESAAFILFDRANMKNYEKKVRGYFGEYADEVLALYPAKTNGEAAAYWAEIWGAVFFDYPHYCLNRLAVENGIPVYEYYFEKDNGYLGSWHSGEEVYLYGNIPPRSRLFDERDRALGAEMLGYFVQFAKTGDPNRAGLPSWEQNLTGEDLMGFGETTAMTKERKVALYQILDRMDGWGA